MAYNVFSVIVYVTDTIAYLLTALIAVSENFRLVPVIGIRYR